MNRVSACRDITSKSSGKKYGIVPARIYQITIIYCALLRQSRDTVPVAEHPYISYGLVTRTFPEYSWNPLYMLAIGLDSLTESNLPLTKVACLNLLKILRLVLARFYYSFIIVSAEFQQFQHL